MAENGSRSPVEPANDSFVKLKVKCNKDGKETFFAIKRRAKMRKLLHSFCQHASVDYRSTRFVINHKTFPHDKNPNQLGLENGDQIDALVDGNGA